MLLPMQILEYRHINIDDPLRAVQDAKALGWNTPEQFRKGIIELLGEDMIPESVLNDDKSVKYLYYYLVQNFVRRDLPPSSIGDIIDMSVQDTARILKRIYGGDMSYVLLGEEYNPDVTHSDEVNPNESQSKIIVKKRGRKGDKKGRAMNLYKENKDIISRSQLVELFIKELSISKACAQTYISICKRDLKE